MNLGSGGVYGEVVFTILTCPRYDAHSLPYERLQPIFIRCLPVWRRTGALEKASGRLIGCVQLENEVLSLPDYNEVLFPSLDCWIYLQLYRVRKGGKIFMWTSECFPARFPLNL